MDKLIQLTADYLSAKSNLLDYLFDDEGISTDDKWRRLTIIEDSRLLPVAKYRDDFKSAIKHLFEDIKQKELYDSIRASVDRWSSKYKKTSLVEIIDQFYGDEYEQDEVLCIIWNWVKVSKVIGFTNNW